MEQDSLGIVGLVVLFLPVVLPSLLLAAVMEWLGIGFWWIAAAMLGLGLLSFGSP